LQKCNQEHDSRQRQQRESHLQRKETERVSADEPTRNDATCIQKELGGPKEPIDHDSLNRNVLSPTWSRAKTDVASMPNVVALSTGFLPGRALRPLELVRMKL
jgi:hypothetical protein